MRISVALASYNGAAYIAEQLDSLAAQTRLPDEIIVSDDGSSDGTSTIVRDWADRHPEAVLILIDGPRIGGYNKNFLRAFGRTTGDLVFPCDQDDVWRPEKIEAMAALMAEDPMVMVAIHDLEITDAVLRPVGQRKLARAQAVGNPLRNYNVGMASVVRGAFLRCCLNVPPGFSYDNWLHHCACVLDGKRIVERPLALYRRHEDNAAGSEILNAQGRQGLVALKIAYLRQVLGSDRSGRDIANEAKKIQQLRNWLETHRAALVGPLVGAARFAALSDRLDGLADLLAERRRIRALWRLRRIVPVLRLVARGGYVPFNGHRAALKDLLI